MSADLTPFVYEGTPVRSVLINGEAWFVVADAAKILGYRDASNAARLLRPHQQGYSEVSTPSGTQRMLVANEGGVNRLIMRSNASNAETVQDWFTDEVMPAIRKTGSYSIREVGISAQHRAELLTRADLARMVLEAEEEKSVLAAALESAAPAVAYHDRYVANGDAATVKVWAAQFGLTQPEAFALLVEEKLIYRVLLGDRWSESEQRKVTEYEYRAYAKYIEWFDLRPQHNAPRHHNGQVRQTLYIRQQFALEIAGKCGLPMQLSIESSVVES